jgi:hypothetical protein
LDVIRSKSLEIVNSLCGGVATSRSANWQWLKLIRVVLDGTFVDHVVEQRRTPQDRLVAWLG